MRTDLERRLLEAYPELFPDGLDPVPGNGMRDGFRCGDGWFDLIDQLCSEIQWWISENRMPPVQVSQIKEKFGTLRFIFSGGNDVTFGMKDLAEAMSACICEECGAPGRLREERNYKLTLCNSHHASMPE